MKIFTLLIFLFWFSNIAQAQEGIQRSDSTVIICVESGNGDPITQIDLGLFQSGAFSNIHYNDEGCIEFILNDLNNSFTFSDGLGMEIDVSGINVADLQMIQDHALGENVLTTPAQLIAGDYTGDGRISAADRVAINNLILGKIDFAYWRLYDKKKSEEEQTGEILIDLNNRFHNIIIFKSGDLDFSYFSDKSLIEKINIKVQDQILNKGEYYTIPLILQEDISTRSVQIEFTQDESLFDQFSYSTLSPDNFILPEDEFEEKIVLLTFLHEVQHLKQGDTLVNIRFRAMENGILSEMLTFHSEENNIAVMPIGQLPKEIVLDWSERIINTNLNELELEKISLYPNPATDFLEIKGISSSVSYHITDILGKQCDAGFLDFNSRLELNKLNAGMYFLTISNSSGKWRTFKFFVSR